MGPATLCIGSHSLNFPNPTLSHFPPTRPEISWSLIQGTCLYSHAAHIKHSSHRLSYCFSSLKCSLGKPRLHFPLICNQLISLFLKDEFHAPLNYGKTTLQDSRAELQSSIPRPVHTHLQAFLLPTMTQRAFLVNTHFWQLYSAPILHSTGNCPPLKLMELNFKKCA